MRTIEHPKPNGRDDALVLPYAAVTIAQMELGFSHALTQIKIRPEGIVGVERELRRRTTSDFRDRGARTYPEALPRTNSARTKEQRCPAQQEGKGRRLCAQQAP